MWTSLKSALVSGGIMAFLAVAGYVIGVGDVFKLNFHAFVNAAIMAFLTAVVSLIKSTLTTENGTVLGVQVK